MKMPDTIDGKSKSCRIITIITENAIKKNDVTRMERNPRKLLNRSNPNNPKMKKTPKSFLFPFPDFLESLDKIKY